MRKEVPERGFKRPFIRYAQENRYPEKLNAIAMNDFMEVMRRPVDLEIALRKHSEFKKPWLWKTINPMEFTLEHRPDIEYPTMPPSEIDNHWPEGTIERITIGRPRPLEPWEGIAPGVPIEPVGLPPYPGGQPAVVPPDMGKAFISWWVIKGSNVWGYVGNLVIYHNDNAYSFASAADFFSRVQLSPSPGWKEAGSADVGYFNNTEGTVPATPEYRAGAMMTAGGPISNQWGVSRALTPAKRRLRAYWGIDYPPGTANNLNLITLESIRIGKVALTIDGKSVPVIGQSVLYEEIGDSNHYYWELNGNITSQLLFGDEDVPSGWPTVNYADGYCRYNGTASYILWPNGEHTD